MEVWGCCPPQRVPYSWVRCVWLGMYNLKTQFPMGRTDPVPLAALQT